MRLVNVHSLDFTEFLDHNRPPYAIASHRWVEDEITLQEFKEGQNPENRGYKKVVEFAEYVKNRLPHIQWLWIDTCCINKQSAAELSESINLMFDWYRDAEICIALLADVDAADDKEAFEKSVWFRRGWTLQELLAPRLVLFVTSTWQVIGHKGAAENDDLKPIASPNVEEAIAQITSIPKKTLHDYTKGLGFSVEERLKWMNGRFTTRPEDMSYAMFGLLGVTLGANYGERYDGARNRLLNAVRQQESKARQDAELYRKIVAWLSPSDPWTNHNAARQLHEPDTGAWLIESAKYQDWKRTCSGDASVRHLWLYGKAGSGKSILCSSAIEDVKALCEGNPTLGYAIFYFSFSDNDKQRIDHLLRSLVSQLGRKDPALAILREAYDRFSGSELSVGKLKDILLACFDSYERVFLVVDALDESPEDNDVRHDVLQTIAQLSHTANNVSILTTSREEPDIRASMIALPGLEPLAVATKSVDADVRRYVAAQLSNDYRLSRLDPHMKWLIEDAISTRSNGMFRWAYCQLQELKKLKSSKPKYLKEALSHLPIDLDATYERMLNSIEQIYIDEAMTLLRWVTYAKRPLAIEELAEAAIIDPDREGSVEWQERGAPEDALHLLSGLITVQEANDEEIYYDSDRDNDSGCDMAVNQMEVVLKGNNEESASNHASDDKGPHDRDLGSSHLQNNEASNLSGHRPFGARATVELAHFSVKEYLESKRILDSSAKQYHLVSSAGHKFLTKSCLTYLMEYSSSCKKSSTVQDIEQFPLLYYAAESWSYHASLQPPGDVAREVSFLTDQSALHDWLRVYDPFQSWPPSECAPLEDYGSGLFYAAYLLLEEVVEGLIQHGENVKVEGNPHASPLLAAVEHDHVRLAKTLIHAGVDVNYFHTAEYNGLALLMASSLGSKEMVELLLMAGANPKVNSSGRRSLWSAASQGHVEVVQRLVRAGVDVNALCQGKDSAFTHASKHGREEIVRLLIDGGANLKARESYGETALHSASRHGVVNVVQLLVNAGADVDTRTAYGSTALILASSMNQNEVLRCLIDAGADLDAQDAQGKTALGSASEHGHAMAFRTLLDAGADIDGGTEPTSTPLRLALADRRFKIAQMLRDAGAHDSMTGSLGSTETSCPTKTEFSQSLSSGITSVDELQAYLASIQQLGISSACTVPTTPSPPTLLPVETSPTPWQRRRKRWRKTAKVSRSLDPRRRGLATTAAASGSTAVATNILNSLDKPRLVSSDEVDLA